jgi:hypothetical protein
MHETDECLQAQANACPRRLHAPAFVPLVRHAPAPRPPRRSSLAIQYEYRRVPCSSSCELRVRESNHDIALTYCGKALAGSVDSTVVERLPRSSPTATPRRERRARGPSGARSPRRRSVRHTAAGARGPGRGMAAGLRGGPSPR